jgi:anti-sigma factor RsiW
LISCSDFMADIGNYLEGDLADEVRLQLENHLAHCQICHVVVDSTRKTLKIVTDTGSFDLPDAVSRPITEKVMARIREAKT